MGVYTAIQEANVSTTRERFEVLKELRDVGIPTVVWLCPIQTTDGKEYINDGESFGFIDFDLAERNIRIYDTCYAILYIFKCKFG